MPPLFAPPAANDCMTAPSGGKDFGVITQEAAKALGVEAGPIRLQVGYPGANGWGALHVLGNAARMSRIIGLGFHSLGHFVETIAQKHEKISDGGNGRLTLVHAFRARTETVDVEVILQAKKATDGSTYWSVTTAIPKGKSRAKVLFEHPKKEEGRTESRGSSLGDASDRPRRETISLPNKVT